MSVTRKEYLVTVSTCGDPLNTCDAEPQEPPLPRLVLFGPDGRIVCGWETIDAANCVNARSVSLNQTITFTVHGVHFVVRKPAMPVESSPTVRSGEGSTPRNGNNDDHKKGGMPCCCSWCVVRTPTLLHTFCRQQGKVGRDVDEKCPRRQHLRELQDPRQGGRSIGDPR